MDLKKIDLNEESTASQILNNLWMGGYPSPGPSLSKLGFDAVVLAAEEYQLPARQFPDVLVFHAPMIDSNAIGMRNGDAYRAMKAARWVVGCLDEGKKVLVSCYQGRNRSGLIVALALVLSTTLRPNEITTLIRACRSTALSNKHFVRFLNNVYAEFKEQRGG